MEVRLNHSSVLFRRIAKPVVLILAMCFFLYVQFRVQLNNGFTTLYGDSYDAAIVVAILQHWWNVFAGDSTWSQLYYFFPYADTLAQTDGYFLIGVIYSLIRVFGFDPFLSSELSNVCVRAIGFLSFYWMLRKVFGLRFGWSVFGAGLFLIANNLTVHGTRIQLATVAFAPFVSVLLHQAYHAFRSGNRVAMAGWGCSGGLALGSWALTCFYMTWFYVFFAFFLFSSLFFMASREQRKELFSDVRQHWWVLGIVAAVALLSFMPLLSIYLPKAAESGVRSYEAAANYLVPLPGVLQVGTTNLLFGEMYNNFARVIFPGYTYSGEYYNTGIAPIIFLIFCFGSALIFFRRKLNSAYGFIAGIAVAACLTWLCVIKVGNFSLWYVVYTFFPGAKALNVVGAYQIFLTFPVVVVVLFYLDKVIDKLPVVVLLVLCGGLVLEELNRSYIALDRGAELAKVSGLVQPPEFCYVFYVGGWPNQVTHIDRLYAHNVSAMLIAEIVRTPTINGFASFNPPDWDLANPNDVDYDQRVRSYLERHSIRNVCKLDLVTKTWAKVDP